MARPAADVPRVPLACLLRLPGLLLSHPADFFFCPSRFEPCGLADIEFGWMGAVQIGHSTGVYGWLGTAAWAAQTAAPHL